MLTALVNIQQTNAVEGQINPIGRVVQLLQGLAKKTESDGKAEEDLFDAYVCWYKTVVSSKKASNAEAKDRIESLTAYIDDVKSGRIEFTSERKDLEAEIEKLNTEIETATDSAALEKLGHGGANIQKQCSGDACVRASCAPARFFSSLSS